MWFSETPVIGLDVGSSLVKAVGLREGDCGIVVERAGIATMPGGAFSQGAVLDAPAVAKTIRRLCRQAGLGSRRVAVAASGEDVILHRLRLSRNGGDSLVAQASAELARWLPFSHREAILDVQAVDESSEGPWILALIVAARQAKVEQLRDTHARAGKAIAVVDATACAVANVLEHNYAPPADESAALLHLGASTMTVCLLRGVSPLAARDVALPQGAATRLERVAAELGRMLVQLHDDVAGERTIQPRSSALTRLWLSGGGARLPGLASGLGERLRLSVQEINPFARLPFVAADKLSRMALDQAHCMAVATGLALRAFDPP